VTLTNPEDTPDVQIAKQAKMIDALVRRASRQKDLGPSAFRAFQSAIELQQRVDAQSLDLARAETELESVRFEQTRTRRALVDALSSMEEGFALYTEGKLDLCNELFAGIAPDIAKHVVPGLTLERYFELVAQSQHLISTDGKLNDVAQALHKGYRDTSIKTVILEFSDNRWFQMNAHRPSNENVVVLLMIDITSIVERNKVEKKTLIDRQADYLQAVFQNMSSGVCTVSDSGDVLIHNARFREILGVPKTVLRHGQQMRPLLDFMNQRRLILKSDIPVIRAWWKSLTAKGWLRKRVNHGPDRVIDVHANRMPGGGFLIELKDVTLEARMTETLENRVTERTAELTQANDKLVREHQKKAIVEEELRLAKERAEAAVSSKTRFLAAASHDLLQPINSAKLLISTLHNKTRNSDHADLVDRLERAFGSAEQLLHSLLDISRLESADPDTVTPTRVSLMSLMQGIYDDQTLIAEQKNVRLDMVPSSIYVRSDPIYLLRSVQNLVVNAIQYTDTGGRVLVGCRRRGDKAILEVWDTGIGIALKDQNRIFDEFTRADNVPVGSGMGLGLSVVDRACRLLGHKLSLRSKPNVGTVLSIEMDIVDTPWHAQQAPSLVLNDEEDLDYIVLVIENDRDVLWSTTQWLEQSGASVLAAQNSDEALEFVTDMGMPPDIILADYELDFGDTGIRAIERIRKLTNTAVPAILITADRSKGLHTAINDSDMSILTKPVKLSRLRSLMFWKVQGHRASFLNAGQIPLSIQTKVDSDSDDQDHSLMVGRITE